MKTVIVVAVVAFALWYFTRDKVNVTGGANVGLTAGNNQYPGYPQYPAQQQPAQWYGQIPGINLPGTINGQSTSWNGQQIGSLIQGIGSGAGQLLTGISSIIGATQQPQVTENYYNTTYQGGGSASQTENTLFGPTLEDGSYFA